MSHTHGVVAEMAAEVRIRPYQSCMNLLCKSPTQIPVRVYLALALRVCGFVLVLFLFSAAPRSHYCSRALFDVR
jgi:hypothetical protein